MSNTTQNTTGAVMVERSTYNALIEERNALRSILAALLEPSEAMSDAFIRGYIASDDGETFSHRRHIQAGFRAAVAAAEREVGA